MASAIGFLVRNEDPRSKDYAAIAQKFRPGHADFTYTQKYGLRDPRGGGRASARETVVRVAAGAIARKWLRERYGVLIRGYLAELGATRVPFQSWEAVDANPFFAANSGMVAQLEKQVDELREAGDSCGARLARCRWCVRWRRCPRRPRTSRPMSRTPSRPRR